MCKPWFTHEKMALADKGLFYHRHLTAPHKWYTKRINSSIIFMLFSKETCAAWALTALRVVVGLVLFSHGYPKLFGDEATKAGLLQFFSSTILPAPSVMLLIAGVLETFGGLFLLAGAFTGVVANIVSVEFLVIILFVKLKMGWNAMEIDLLILTSLQVLGALGAGALSVEKMMGKKESESVPVQPGMGK